MAKSAWFWNTPEWLAYQKEYDAARPDATPIYQSSPLADDHDFEGMPSDYSIARHLTQVVALAPNKDLLWSAIRPSYHSLIHRANEQYTIEPAASYSIYDYQRVHATANGRQPRSNATYMAQGQWLKDGLGMLMGARNEKGWQAFGYFIIWQGCSYYMSGPSLERSVQHAIIWEAMVLLKAHGVRLLELGRLDGETQKEINIGHFKAGFGGSAQPFYIAEKRR